MHQHVLRLHPRYILVRNPDVEFCGYSVPHPSDLKFNLRVQTKGADAVETVKSGLENLAQLSEALQAKFEQANGDWDAIEWNERRQR